MNKAPILLVVLFAVGLAGAFLVWSGSDAGTGLPLLSEVDAEATLVDDTSAEALEVEIGEDGLEADDELVADDSLGIDREEVTTSGTALVVQVWNGKRGVPAAEAKVSILDGLVGAEPKDPFAPHWSDRVLARGQEYRADLQGRVSLPSVRGEALVVASLPGAHGFVKVGRRHRNIVTITMQVDETVNVRVVDGDGQPVVGVPVGLVQRVPTLDAPAKRAKRMQELKGNMADAERYMREHPAQREAVMRKMNALRKAYTAEAARMKRGKGASRARSPKLVKSKRGGALLSLRSELRAQRRTDEHGIAVFRHFQINRRERGKNWPDDEVDRYEAMLLMPLREDVSVAFQGRPVSSEVLELRLPPTGSLTLRTVDRDGRPFSHPVYAALAIHEFEGQPLARLRVRKEQDEVVIEFPFVGLGLQLSAKCRLDDDDFRWDLDPFVGPARAGESVELELVVAPAAGMLFGRLLNGQGDPLASARPTFLINSALGRLEGEKVQLGRDGRFHLPYHVQRQHRAPFRLEIRRGGVKPLTGIVLHLDALPKAQVSDLGDLEIGIFGPVVSGIVTDDRGLPVVDATVQLQRQRDLGKEKPRLGYVDEAFIVCQTDDEGQYELFGELESSPYRLRVRARDHFQVDSRDLRRGEPLDVSLLRKSRVLGTVLLPNWMRSHRVRVKLESVSDPKQKRDDRIREYKGKKHVFFDWVRPGTYSLAFRMQDFPDPFLRLDGIEIVAGQIGAHPRLRAIDLGAYLYRFEISAVDGQGRSMKPQGPLVARIERPGGVTSFLGFPWVNGRAEIFSVSPQLEVWPVSAGYHAAPAVVGSGKSVLPFLKIPPVSLQLTGLRQLLGTTPAWIQVRHVGEGPGPSALDTWDGRSRRIAGWLRKVQTTYVKLGRKDGVALALTFGGRYEIRAHIGQKGRGAGLVAVKLGFVEILLVPGSGPLELRLAVDASAVQAALQQLAQGSAAGGKGR